jgi:hypothetical protein
MHLTTLFLLASLAARSVRAATIGSTQQILASWFTESGEFSGLANTKPIVGYPYTSGYEVPFVPEPTTVLLALLAVLLRVPRG